MSKYTELFVQHFGQRIRDLLQRDAALSEKELCALVHMAKGTAGTLGLPSGRKSRASCSMYGIA